MTETERVMRELGGRLACRTSARDARVRECRGSFADPGGTGSVNVVVSAIDGHTAVALLKAPLEGGRLERWRNALQATLGPTDAEGAQVQWKLEWRRARRMVRLTWRARPPDQSISVSLVDGVRLDAWQVPARTPAR